jgi:hypothetical protein
VRSTERPALFSRWHQVAASAITMLLGVGAAWAQSSTSATTTVSAAPDTAVASGLRWHWATSAGLNSYSEDTSQGSMRLQGPELGLHLRMSDVAWGGHWGLEADVLYGRQDYESSKTGRKTDIPNIETRSRIMYAHTAQRTSGPSMGLSYGLAFHTLWNNLEGPTTTGHGGYLRKAFQLWAPVRWREGLAPGAWATAWTAEGGVLISGQHTSMLSQVNAIYPDVTNRQDKGVYLQFSSEHRQGLRAGAWSPYVRFTWLGDSDTVTFPPATRLTPGTEPMSRRWQVGAQWLLP